MTPGDLPDEVLVLMRWVSDLLGKATTDVGEDRLDGKSELRLHSCTLADTTGHLYGDMYHNLHVGSPYRPMGGVWGIPCAIGT